MELNGTWIRTLKGRDYNCLITYIIQGNRFTYIMEDIKHSRTDAERGTFEVKGNMIIFSADEQTEDPNLKKWRKKREISPDEFPYKLTDGTLTLTWRKAQYVYVKQGVKAPEPVKRNAGGKQLDDVTIEQRMEQIGYKEAEKQYGLSKYIRYPFMDFADGDEGEVQQIRVFKGDLEVDSIESTMTRDWNLYSLIIDGNLKVSGDIEWCETGNGSFIFVTGNVSARNVILKGNPEMVVLGDLEAKIGIMGNEGEDGGRLKVKGTAKAPVILQMYYFIMDLCKTEGVFVDFDDEEEAAQLLMSKFYDKDDEVFDDSAIEEALKGGKKVLKKK